MITDRNLEELFAKLGKKEIVTRTEILDCGFKEHDVKALCVRGYIEKISHGKYSAVKSKTLLDEKFKKCLELLENNSLKEAKDLFLECLKYNNEYMDKIFSSIFEYLNNENYSMVFKCFELVLASNDIKYINDVKFYLYLLNYVTDIPEKYKGIVELLSFGDVKISSEDDRYGDVIEQYNLRRDAIEKKRFGFYKKGTLTIYEKIIKNLIYKCKGVFQQHLKELDLYAERKEYSLLVASLTRREKEYGLDNNARLNLLVGLHIIAVMNNKINFEISTKTTNDWRKAVDFGNFNLAMQLLEKEGHTNYSIYLLLKELTILLKKRELDEKFKKCLENLESTDIEETKKLFLECLEYDNEYMAKLFDFILGYIINKNYSMVFKCFELVLASDDEFYVKDVKFYSYLLNYLTVIPTKFKDLINEIEYHDIELSADDKRYSFSRKINEIRYMALHGEKCAITKSDCKNNMDLINYILWKRYGGKVVSSTMSLGGFIDNHDYKTLVECLDYEGERRNLSNGLLLIKFLAQCICNIQNDIYPHVSTESAENEYDAAYKGNFELAYQLRLQRKLNKGESSNDIGLKFLNEIITLLDSKNQKLAEEKDISCSSATTFNDIYDLLLNNSKDRVNRAIEMLPGYLQSIGKGGYEFLIVNLIKICELENDTTFYVPLVFLAQMKNGNFVFDVEFYINKVKEALFYEDINVANKYLDILRGAEKIGIVVPSAIFEKSSEAMEKVTDRYYYGIENIIEIRKMIETTNLGIEQACSTLNINSNETVNLIRLIYAKDYYSCGLYENGDKLFRAVEKSKNKSAKLKKAIEEVREQKKFYSNQVRSTGINVVRVLKP